ncbi:NAD(P)H-dependent oxidoreductase [Bacillus sp. APMAM]|nr:NAD(P)H-dependent oxidoreductase [Bacillus sp. APMAM]RTZ53318.1 flavodoxin family protein [Bacillus sp. SAJ1]
MKIYVVFDSENGHTEALAEAISEGARGVDGAEVFINHVSNANVRDLEDMDAIIWGCPGHFGTISAGLKAWIDKLDYLWAHGKLVGKVGACFCTTATTHGGIEATMLNLITPMLHQGMIVVGLPGNIPENAVYGSYYGVGISCPVDESDGILTKNDIALGKALGKRVGEITKKLVGAQSPVVR